MNTVAKQLREQQELLSPTIAPTNLGTKLQVCYVIVKEKWYQRAIRYFPFTLMTTSKFPGQVLGKEWERIF